MFHPYYIHKALILQKEIENSLNLAPLSNHMDQKSKHSAIILFLSRIFKLYFRFELTQLKSQSFFYFFSLAYAKEV